MTNAECRITRVRDEYCDPLHTGDDEVDVIPSEESPVIRQAVISGIITSEAGATLVNHSGEELKGARKPTGRRHFQVIYDSESGQTVGRMVGISEVAETPEQISLGDARTMAPENVRKARTKTVRKSKGERRTRTIPF